MDMGPGSLLGLARSGIDTRDLRGILITHRHADHCCELAWLLQLERAKGRTEPLRIAGPDILQEYLDFFRSWGRVAPQPDPFIVELSAMPGKVTWTDLDIEGISVPHVDHSLGFRIQCKHRTLAYTGDTGPGQELVELSQQADLLISECTLPKGVCSKVHINPEQVAQMAASAGVKRVLLSHFPPGADTITAVEICRDYGLDALAAQDGMQLEI